VSADDLELARQLHGTMDSGDLEALYSLLCDDVEWVTDRRTLRGLAEIREKFGEKSSESLENLDPEWDGGEWERGGDGAVVCQSRFVLRWKETGEIATSSNVRETVTSRDGKVARYERRVKWG